MKYLLPKTTILTLVLGVAILLSGGRALAFATFDNPANSRQAANCNSFTTPTQIHGGKDDGKWWCKAKPASQPPQGNPGAGGGAGAQGGNGASTPAADEACSSFNQLGSGVSCQQGSTAGQTVIGNTVGRIVNIISFIIGIAAVIMVIFAGFRFITSNGDSTKVSSAKMTLIYALIGVAIAALAQLLVHFVLSTSNGV